MMEKLKKNRFLVIVALIYIGTFTINTNKAVLSVKNSGYYIKEMLIIMPVIFLLTALIDAWIPKESIMEYLGEGSGGKGALISLLLGSVSAGPLYAAFPVCKTLLNKGASVSNIVILLSSWAVIKVPMLANEAKFLSPKFMIARWILTTIAIFTMAYIISKIVKREDIPMEESIEEGKISIREEYCIGCGVCANMAPKYFEMDGNKAIVINNKITKITEEKLKEAEGKCPTDAIKVGWSKNMVD